MPSAPPGQKKIAAFLYQRWLVHPATALMELQADAETALHQFGDFRSAVMLAYTASEVLLDGVLMALCWEEGMTADETAQVFSVLLFNRVRTQYHGRLGGNWATTARAAVGKWRSQLALLRHHVAHTGLLPEREDAEQALAAHRSLRGFVLDRLTASMRRYPTAVGMFVSEAGLKRRGAWTKKGGRSPPISTLRNCRRSRPGAKLFCSPACVSANGHLRGRPRSRRLGAVSEGACPRGEMTD